MELVHTQAGQLTQAHIDNGLTLQFVEFETRFQVALGLNRGLTATNNMHNFVDIVASYNQTFENMGTLLRLFQVVFRAANGHIMPVLHEILHTFFQAQQAWTALHKGNTIHRERALQGRHLEEFVQNDIGIGIAFYVDDNAHSLSSRLIIRVTNTVDLAFFHEFSDIFDQHLLVDAIRNLRYDNLIVALSAFDFSLGTHHDASSSRLICLTYALYTIYICTRREVGSLDILH